MQKIDRLVWAAGLSFVSYGVRVGIRTNKPEALEQVLDCLPPVWKPASSPIVGHLYSLIVGDTPTRHNVRLYNILYGGPARLARTFDRDELFGALESDLALNIAYAARRRVFVHAGVVGWRGQAIVIPGRSFSGKTTLVRELVRAGATYYSDEFAVLDAEGRVFPYSRPLAIREENGQGGWRTNKCQVETLGGVPGVRPLPVGLVVVSHYKPEAAMAPPPDLCGTRSVSVA